GKPLNVVASRDGTTIAADSTTGEIVFWDSVTLTANPPLRSDLTSIARLAISDDGKLIAAAGPSSDPRIEIWDVPAAKRLETLPRATGAITGLDFQPRGKLLATSDLNGSLKLWNIQDGQLVKTISASTDQSWFSGLAFSPDGTLIATTSPNGDIQFRDTA